MYEQKSRDNGVMVQALEGAAVHLNGPGHRGACKVDTLFVEQRTMLTLLRHMTYIDFDRYQGLRRYTDNLMLFASLQLPEPECESLHSICRIAMRRKIWTRKSVAGLSEAISAVESHGGHAEVLLRTGGASTLYTAMVWATFRGVSYDGCSVLLAKHIIGEHPGAIYGVR